MSVVVATRDREELLRHTVASILGQDYAGEIDVTLVYDQAVPQASHEHSGDRRRVRVVANDRAPGLAGARNAGIGRATGDLIAFCDDDDTWRPDKLRRQVEALEAARAGACVTGISVRYDDTVVERIPAVDEITTRALRESRLTGAHPSSYVMRRDVVAQVGDVDEQIPGGYGEDYDWLVRLAEVGRVVVVRAPLVDVLWHRGSFFSTRWSAMVESVDYLVAKYPVLVASRPGIARLRGQQAFALAALGNRAGALSHAWKAWRANPLEPRVYVTLAVASGLVSATRVMHLANSRGRGI